MNEAERMEELLGRELAGETLCPAEQEELEALATGPLAAERAAMRALAAEVRAQLTPPALDLAKLAAEEPPPWMLRELEAAVGIKPWAAVKEQAAAARAATPTGGSLWSAMWLRWAALGAVVIAVALPLGLSLREEGSSKGGVRGVPRDTSTAPTLLAPLGQTGYQQPAFLWLPAPGQTGPVKLTLSVQGKQIWAKDGARAPLKLADDAAAPALQAGVAYTWVVQPAEGSPAEGKFTLTPDAKGFPVVPDSVSAALAAANEAASAGRPADGVMLLALLPSELRADEQVRALRRKLTESLIANP